MSDVTKGIGEIIKSISKNEESEENFKKDNDWIIEIINKLLNKKEK